MYISFWALGLLVVSCDVDSAMLFGSKGDGYEFTNENLEDGFEVDESLVDVFTLTSDDNGDKATIYALYVGDKSRIATDTVILYCHGNGPYLDLFWPKIGQLATIGGQHRYGVMAYDYRGFGQSEGTSTGLGTMNADVDACLEWLKANGLTDDRLVILGESLGSIPATYVVGENRVMMPAKYIIEVPQSTADAIAQDAARLSLPSDFLTDFNFNLVAEMARYDGQVLWMHGTEDNVAPIENARKVYDAHNGEYKAAVIVEGAGHGLRWDMGFDEWEKPIFSFILAE